MQGYAPPPRIQKKISDQQWMLVRDSDTEQRSKFEMARATSFFDTNLQASLSQFTCLLHTVFDNDIHYHSLAHLRSVTMSFELQPLQPKLVKYKDADPDERAALIPAAVDYWNNEIHYWDRRNKQAKMMASPYSFYRGTDSLYWFDFGQDSRVQKFGNEHTFTWLSGDYHAYNAGSFHGQDQVVYGLNDFDESVIADYQLDLWRLAVSVVLIARSNKNLDDKDLTAVIGALSAKYLERMRHFVDHKPAIQECITKDNAYGKLKDFLEIVEENYTREEMLDEWAPTGNDGVRRFDLALEKLGSATAQEKEEVTGAMYAYWKTLENPPDVSKFKVLDIARRLLAGTGSLGMNRFYVLVQDDASKVVRIIDIKEQCKPAPYPYMGASAQELFHKHAGDNSAKAVVIATRTMSVRPDPFVGWMKLGDKVYSVAERSPWKGSYPALVEEATKKFKKLVLDSKKRYEKLAEQWAWVLASHHAYARREEKESLETNVVKLVGNQDEAFQELVRTIAFEYADQVEKDWESFKRGLGADVTADPEE